jgi:UDP-hydrolysing UDP-N-acetyl-D-glucosamine 2-epimerase
MIGDGWDGDPSTRPQPDPAQSDRPPRRVAVVTGSRAEFGLLRPVMTAIANQEGLELAVIAAGSHLILPADTFREIKAAFAVADSVPMQVAGRTTRFDDAEAVGRGVARFARSYAGLAPSWVVVLGDRIEAFAAASAASIAGYTLVHIHGGDRAEGIADEAMRHAITKLAHVHFAASEQSAERIRKMGERPEFVFLSGSPAIDGLDQMPAMTDEEFAALGSPEAVVLMHPIGRPDEAEEHATNAVLSSLDGKRVLALHPNHDPGRAGVLRAIQNWAGSPSTSDPAREVRQHLSRPHFVGLLKRLARGYGVLVGNSSSGLIEAAALGVAVVDIGQRQAGRERPAHVVHEDHESPGAISNAIHRSIDLASALPAKVPHPYGEGHASSLIAQTLAHLDPNRRELIRKRISY